LSPPDIAGLKILAFCDYFTPESSGGAERVAAEVFSRLIGWGADVTMISAVPGARPHSTQVQGVPTRTVRARSLATPLRVQAAWATGLRGAARDALETRPDVIHVSGLHFHGSVFGARLARRHGIPLVATAHVGSIEALPPLVRWATTGYERTFARRIVRTADQTIAVSETVADHVCRLGASAVSVIPNGVDHDQFSPDPDPSSHPFEVAFVGRLIGNKAPNQALEAFATIGHPAARLTFVGDGPMRSTLERSAARLGATVRFLGHQSDVASILRSSHVLVRPSQTEGQSLTILEAMASGVAVVASDIAANRELIEADETGLLHRVGDSADLGAALGRLLTDTDLRKRLASNAHASAQRFTWDRCATETAAVLLSAS
jgi:glycosyltransferase involved in cell wall biosynthesis